MKLLPDLTVDDTGLVEIAPDASPLDFLSAVYRDARQPMTRRMRAAIEALPFAHPKLAATFIASDGIAARLERALAHSKKLIDVPQADTTLEGVAFDLTPAPEAASEPSVNRPAPQVAGSLGQD